MDQSSSRPLAPASWRKWTSTWRSLGLNGEVRADTASFHLPLSLNPWTLMLEALSYAFVARARRSQIAEAVDRTEIVFRSPISQSTRSRFGCSAASGHGFGSRMTVSAGLLAWGRTSASAALMGCAHSGTAQNGVSDRAASAVPVRHRRAVRPGSPGVSYAVWCTGLPDRGQQEQNGATSVHGTVGSIVAENYPPPGARRRFAYSMSVTLGCSLGMVLVGTTQ